MPEGVVIDRQPKDCTEWPGSTLHPCAMTIWAAYTQVLLTYTLGVISNWRLYQILLSPPLSSAVATVVVIPFCKHIVQPVPLDNARASEGEEI